MATMTLAHIGIGSSNRQSVPNPAPFWIGRDAWAEEEDLTARTIELTWIPKTGNPQPLQLREVIEEYTTLPTNRIGEIIRNTFARYEGARSELAQNYIRFEARVLTPAEARYIPDD